MKFLLSILTVLSFNSYSYASKARVNALQGANHIVDTQTIFANPAHISLLNPYLTFEMGAAGNGAEGGFARKLSNGNMLGIYLGHDNTNDLRDGTTFIKQQNPIEVTYGKGDMAFSGSLSTIDNKKSGTKETTLVGKYGAINGDMAYYAHLALISSAEKKGTPDQKISSSPYITLGGNKDMGTNRFFGSLVYGNTKAEAGTVETTTKDMNITLGWEDRSMKTTDADIYYGAMLENNSRDIEGKKVTLMQLPVFIGLELNLNSWSMFRASLSQNVILGSTKDETVSNDADGINNNTTVATGLGFKHNNLTLDGLLSASTTGQINGTAFMTSAAVTYNF